MKLSVVIPAYNEAGQIESTLKNLDRYLEQEGLDHEILVVNDHSNDQTELLLQRICLEIRTIRYINNPNASGFGLAVRAGLDVFAGEVVAIYMADASDRPEDLVAFYRKMIIDNTDCAFGSRFMPGGQVVDYPTPKLFLNRLANTFIRLVFGIGYNDITNAFKLYRRNVIDGVRPLLSNHFNLTVELPLKAIVRGYSYSIVPNHWINRKAGESKLKIKEMGSRYLFIVLYCFIEKWLSRGDYRRIAKEREKEDAKSYAAGR